VDVVSGYSISSTSSVTVSVLVVLVVLVSLTSSTIVSPPVTAHNFRPQKCKYFFGAP